MLFLLCACAGRALTASRASISHRTLAVTLSACTRRAAGTARPQVVVPGRVGPAAQRPAQRRASRRVQRPHLATCRAGAASGRPSCPSPRSRLVPASITPTACRSPCACGRGSLGTQARLAGAQHRGGRLRLLHRRLAAKPLLKRKTTCAPTITSPLTLRSTPSCASQRPPAGPASAVLITDGRGPGARSPEPARCSYRQLQRTPSASQRVTCAAAPHPELCGAVDHYRPAVVPSACHRSAPRRCQSPRLSAMSRGCFAAKP